MIEGFFCVLEGIDGSGKSTLAAALGKKIELNLKQEAPQGGQTAGKSRLQLLVEPTRSQSGQKIRRLLASSVPADSTHADSTPADFTHADASHSDFTHPQAASKEKLTRKEWLELFWKDREYNVFQNIIPALQRGSIVLQDRYFYSTAAYQGSTAPSTPSAETPQGIVRRSLAANFPAPDLLLFLEIDTELALKRLVQKNSQRDCFEFVQFLEQVDDNYRQILPADTVYLDASRPAEELLTPALEALQKRLKIKRSEKRDEKGSRKRLKRNLRRD